MEVEQSPGWLRALEIIFGIIAIIFAFYIIVIPMFLTWELMLLLFAIGLLFMGLMAIFRGLFNREMPGWLRGLNIIMGIFLVILAPFPLLTPYFATWMILWLMSFGLIFYGLTALMMGIVSSDAPGWYRALLIILGPILMILGFYVIIYPLWGISFTVWILCFGLIFAGLELMVAGFTGQKFRQRQ